MKLFSKVHFYVKHWIGTTFKVSIPGLAPTFLTLAVLSVFCLRLLVVCLLLCLSLVLSLLFNLSLGTQMKSKPVYFFLQRLLNISVLHFALFSVLPLFFSLFPRPLWCVFGFVIIPFGWAHRLRCTSSRTVALFLLETKGTHVRARSCLYFPRSAPPRTALKYSAYLKGIFTTPIRVPSVVC